LRWRRRSRTSPKGCIGCKAFAIRFNRFRKERGHLFQGRYNAILLEDDAILVRVVHYIHLNPVRAHIVAPAECATFRWSSLRHLRQPLRPQWLSSEAIRGVMSFRDSVEGWNEYEQFLADLGSDPREQERLGFGRLSRGWAIGTHAWKRELARDYSYTALLPGLDRDERQELQTCKLE
jgi:putative transposase